MRVNNPKIWAEIQRYQKIISSAWYGSCAMPVVLVDWQSQKLFSNMDLTNSVSFPIIHASKSLTRFSSVWRNVGDNASAPCWDKRLWMSTDKYVSSPVFGLIATSDGMPRTPYLSARLWGYEAHSYRKELREMSYDFEGQSQNMLHPYLKKKNTTALGIMLSMLILFWYSS